MRIENMEKAVLWTFCSSSNFFFRYASLTSLEHISPTGSTRQNAHSFALHRLYFLFCLPRMDRSAVSYISNTDISAVAVVVVKVTVAVVEVTVAMGSSSEDSRNSSYTFLSEIDRQRMP